MGERWCFSPAHCACGHTGFVLRVFLFARSFSPRSLGVAPRPSRSSAILSSLVYSSPQTQCYFASCLLSAPQYHTPTTLLCNIARFCPLRHPTPSPGPAVTAPWGALVRYLLHSSGSAPPAARGPGICPLPHTRAVCTDPNTPKYLPLRSVHHLRRLASQPCRAAASSRKPPDGPTHKTHYA